MVLIYLLKNNVNLFVILINYKIINSFFYELPVVSLVYFLIFDLAFFLLLIFFSILSFVNTCFTIVNM